MRPLEELNAVLSRWLRWLRLRRAVHWGLHGLAGGLAAALAAAILVIPRLFLLPKEFAGLAFGLVLAGALAGILAGLLWPQPRMAAARFFDRKFELQERMSAALELADEIPEVNSLREAILARQCQDALTAARRVDPVRKLPLRLSWFEILGVVLLSGAVILSGIWWGEAYFQAAHQRRLVKTAIEAEREQVEELSSQLEQLETLTPDQREDLMRHLDQANQALQNAESLEQAVSALREAERELRQLVDESVLDQIEALKRAGENLAGDSGSSLQPTGQHLAEGDLEAAAEALAGMEVSDMSAEEAAQAASDLEQLAQSVESTNPELAQSLNEAAQALREGDSQAAQEALEQAAQEMESSAQQGAQAQAAQAAAGELESQASSLLNNSSLAQETGQQPGSSGSGQGNRDGQESQGSSTSEGTIDTNNGPGDGGEQPYQSLYIPQRLGGEEEDTVDLPGSGEPGEQVTGEKDVPPGEAGDVRTPYQDVLPAYREALRRAIESGQVPVHLRPLIRDYFSSLEP